MSSSRPSEAIRPRVEIVPVTPFAQNCAILYDGDSMEGAVVDPGGDVERIVAAVARLGVTVAAIWLTHGHIDHAGGAMELKDKLRVPLVGPHEADRPLLEAIQNQARMFGVPGAFRDVVPDRFLVEGEVLSLGRHRFEVLHCPGHAPGHVVFFERKARFLHAGDVLFRGSVGRTDLWGGDHAALIRSIKTKLLPLGDDVDFICGHGPGGTLGQERLTNPFLN
ncbi:MBL fold metallo-hydrolase [Aureimonas leprariae]|uniref:MBL fold metallo-hydrolase n=1 Tax=Plantimonas leprariae TaxID=2615207 RepID=A0A7V7PPH9_9HYPH|nr:MBL fold metallo-hydrolase [Aureimonas leprariae]KAB0679797.1 MBL fold metallo-hydrolase [Aureimonas leprariae]